MNSATDHADSVNAVVYQNIESIGCALPESLDQLIREEKNVKNKFGGNNQQQVVTAEVDLMDVSKAVDTEYHAESSENSSELKVDSSYASDGREPIAEMTGSECLFPQSALLLEQQESSSKTVDSDSSILLGVEFSSTSDKELTYSDKSSRIKTYVEAVGTETVTADNGNSPSVQQQDPAVTGGNNSLEAAMTEEVPNITSYDNILTSNDGPTEPPSAVSLDVVVSLSSEESSESTTKTKDAESINTIADQHEQPSNEPEVLETGSTVGIEDTVLSAHINESQDQDQQQPQPQPVVDTVHTAPFYDPFAVETDEVNPLDYFPQPQPEFESVEETGNASNSMLSHDFIGENHHNQEENTTETINSLYDQTQTINSAEAYEQTQIESEWVRYVSDDGHPYFYNTVSGESVWEGEEEDCTGNTETDHTDDHIYDHTSSQNDHDGTRGYMHQSPPVDAVDVDQRMQDIWNSSNRDGSPESHDRLGNDSHAYNADSNVVGMTDTFITTPVKATGSNSADGGSGGRGGGLSASKAKVELHLNEDDRPLVQRVLSPPLQSPPTRKHASPEAAKSQVAEKKTLHTLAAECDSDGLDFMICAGTSVNEVDSEGRTALQILCQQRPGHGLNDVSQGADSPSLRCVRLLVNDHEADTRIIDRQGNSLLHLCASSNNSEVLQFLLSLEEPSMRTDVEQRNMDGLTALELATQMGAYNCVQHLQKEQEQHQIAEQVHQQHEEHQQDYHQQQPWKQNVHDQHAELSHYQQEYHHPLSVQHHPLPSSKFPNHHNNYHTQFANNNNNISDDSDSDTEQRQVNIEHHSSTLSATYGGQLQFSRTTSQSSVNVNIRQTSAEEERRQKLRNKLASKRGQPLSQDLDSHRAAWMRYEQVRDSGMLDSEQYAGAAEASELLRQQALRDRQIVADTMARQQQKQQRDSSLNSLNSGAFLTSNSANEANDDFASHLSTLQQQQQQEQREWVECYTVTGDVYYYHPATEVVQWENPYEIVDIHPLESTTQKSPSGVVETLYYASGSDALLPENQPTVNTPHAVAESEYQALSSPEKIAFVGCGIIDDSINKDPLIDRLVYSESHTPVKPNQLAVTDSCEVMSDEFWLPAPNENYQHEPPHVSPQLLQINSQPHEYEDHEMTESQFETTPTTTPFLPRTKSGRGMMTHTATVEISLQSSMHPTLTVSVSESYNREPRKSPERQLSGHKTSTVSWQDTSASLSQSHSQLASTHETPASYDSEPVVEYNRWPEGEQPVDYRQYQQQHQGLYYPDYQQQDSNNAEEEEAWQAVETGFAQTISKGNHNAGVVASGDAAEGGSLSSLSDHWAAEAPATEAQHQADKVPPQLVTQAGTQNYDANNNELISPKSHTGTSTPEQQQQQRHLQIWSKFFENASTGGGGGGGWRGNTEASEREQSQPELILPANVMSKWPAVLSDRKYTALLGLLQSEPGEERGGEPRGVPAEEEEEEVDEGLLSQALFAAANRNDVPTVQSLLLSGANPNSRDAQGRSPVHYGSRNGGVELLSVLYDQGSDLEMKDGSGRTPLHVSAVFNQGGAVDFLLGCAVNGEAVDHDGNTALHLAARSGSIEGCTSLVAFAPSTARYLNNEGMAPAEVARTVLDAVSAERIVIVLQTAASAVDEATAQQTMQSRTDNEKTRKPSRNRGPSPTYAPTNDRTRLARQKIAGIAAGRDDFGADEAASNRKVDYLKQRARETLQKNETLNPSSSSLSSSPPLSARQGTENSDHLGERKSIRRRREQEHQQQQLDHEHSSRIVSQGLSIMGPPSQFLSIPPSAPSPTPVSGLISPTMDPSSSQYHNHHIKVQQHQQQQQSQQLQHERPNSSSSENNKFPRLLDNSSSDDEDDEVDGGDDINEDTEERGESVMDTVASSLWGVTVSLINVGLGMFSSSANTTSAASKSSQASSSNHSSADDLTDQQYDAQLLAKREALLAAQQNKGWFSGLLKRKDSEEQGVPGDVSPPSPAVAPPTDQELYSKGLGFHPVVPPSIVAHDIGEQQRVVRETPSRQNKAEQWPPTPPSEVVVAVAMAKRSGASPAGVKIINGGGGKRTTSGSNASSGSTQHVSFDVSASVATQPASLIARLPESPEKPKRDGVAIVNSAVPMSSSLFVDDAEGGGGGDYTRVNSNSSGRSGRSGAITSRRGGDDTDRTAERSKRQSGRPPLGFNPTAVTSGMAPPTASTSIAPSDSLSSPPPQATQPTATNGYSLGSSLPRGVSWRFVDVLSQTQQDQERKSNSKT